MTKPSLYPCPYPHDRTLRSMLKAMPSISPLSWKLSLQRPDGKFAFWSTGSSMRYLPIESGFRQTAQMMETSAYLGGMSGREKTKRARGRAIRRS